MEVFVIFKYYNKIFIEFKFGVLSLMLLFFYSVVLMKFLFLQVSVFFLIYAVRTN